MNTRVVLQLALACIGVALLIAGLTYISTDAALGWIGAAGGALVIVGAVLRILRIKRAARH